MMRPHPFRSSKTGCRHYDHNLLMLGPPGAGKSRLGRWLTTILPALTLAEAIETTRIHRVAGLTGSRTAVVTTRPFRVPHHTISDVGLIGRGQVPLPGEVSLALHGMLLLDELPECRRHVLEVLRQPFEEGSYTDNFAGVMDANAPKSLGDHNRTGFFRQCMALSTDGMPAHVPDRKIQIHLTAPPETL
jgi:MoxR-like ATPase